MPGKRSFELVYEDHFSYVYNMLYMHTMHKQTAEDLTSDTFMRAMQAYDRYDPTRASERTWLTVIANRLLYNFYRSRAARKTEPAEDEVMAAIPCTDALLESLSDSTEDAVRKLLSCLDEQERHLLVMRYYSEMRNPEIAAALGTTPKAVSERCRRLLAKCRTIMEQERLTEWL